MRRSRSFPLQWISALPRSSTGTGEFMPSSRRACSPARWLEWHCGELKNLPNEDAARHVLHFGQTLADYFQLGATAFFCGPVVVAAFERHPVSLQILRYFDQASPGTSPAVFQTTS